MAIIHQATLTPSKPELLTSRVPTRPWLGGADTSTLEEVGAFRFDDPDGEVGIETHLLRAADGRIVQVPLDVQTPDGPKRRDATTRVVGSGGGTAPPPPGPASSTTTGTTTVITFGGLELVVLRVLGTEPDGSRTLVGTWPGRDEPAVLAFARGG